MAQSDLSLTEDQKKQLKPILAGEFKQMRAAGEDASLTQDQKREKMKQIHEASRPQVQAILTPEQRQKFAQMKEEAKERRGEQKDKGPSDYQRTAERVSSRDAPSTGPPFTNIGRASMTPSIQVGTILIEDRPLVTGVLDLESESYSGNWSVVKAMDGFALDLKIHATGWSFFFMAEEVKATVFGSLTPNNIQKALKRIFLKMRKQDFNCLEVTKMVENRFLGVPYITVWTHPRHIQKGCWLDSAQERATARQKEIHDSGGTMR